MDFLLTSKVSDLANTAKLATVMSIYKPVKVMLAPTFPSDTCWQITSANYAQTVAIFAYILGERVCNRYLPAQVVRNLMR